MPPETLCAGLKSPKLAPVSSQTLQSLLSCLVAVFCLAEVSLLYFDRSVRRASIALPYPPSDFLLSVFFFYPRARSRIVWYFKYAYHLPPYIAGSRFSQIPRDLHLFVCHVVGNVFFFCCFSWDRMNFDLFQRAISTGDTSWRSLSSWTYPHVNRFVQSPHA